MAIQLKPVQTLANSHGIKCLIYGRAGLGKTCLVATAPAPVLISAESGLLSLKKDNLIRLYGENTQGITYDLPVIEIKTFDDLINAEIWARTSKEATQFQTICIDSLTEIGEIVLSNMRKQTKDPRQAYGELIDKMQTTVKSFRDLRGKHVYMSAKEERLKSDENVVSIIPSMPGTKLGPQLPYLFDEVFYLGKGVDAANKTEYRYLRTQPDFRCEAKDRSGALAELETPHLGYVFGKIAGHVPA